VEKKGRADLIFTPERGNVSPTEEEVTSERSKHLYLHDHLPRKETGEEEAKKGRSQTKRLAALLKGGDLLVCKRLIGVERKRERSHASSTQGIKVEKNLRRNQDLKRRRGVEYNPLS